MIKIKFCGIMSENDVSYVNDLKPDYIGFIFAQFSRRYVTPERAVSLKKRLDKCISAAGVFANETIENVAEVLNNGIIDIIQLHGDESEKYIEELRTLTDRPIIKAFRITNIHDVIAAEKSSADFILLDSERGGSGRTFDWKLVKGMSRPFFLAGGLNSNNINNALKHLRPYAVDISSGIETEGVKDKLKMLEIINIVRGRNEI